MFRYSVALGLMIVLVTSMAADAQQRRGRRGSSGRAFGSSNSLASIVGMPEIQQELELSDDQKKLLEALLADLRDQGRGVLRGGFGVPRGGADGPLRPEQFRERLESMNQRGEQLVMVVLEPKQSIRLKELRIQREGVRALDRSEVSKTLELTKEQLEEIRRIRSEASTAPGRAGERPTAPPSRDTLRKLETDIMAVLSDEQKNQWEQLKGEPFRFPERFSGRGPSGGRSQGPSNDP